MAEKELRSDKLEQSPLALLFTPLIIPAVVISEVGYITLKAYSLARDYTKRIYSPTGNRTQASST